MAHYAEQLSEPQEYSAIMLLAGKNRIDGFIA
jgi:hypothetical protein